jgi:cytidine deaminase
MKLTNEQREDLIRNAREARERAYAPYSNYSVGAALLSTDGKITMGANVENALYNLGTCAERAAVFTAVSQGLREFTAIAVASRNGGSPCGGCRQVLSEFGLDLQVITLDEEGRITIDKPLRDLLPESFGSVDLEHPEG